ncbi:MAG: 50S ribosomal protein L29 [Candidatus Buchananbacteria bacterium]|nr:50S ribosomal protein L29 [Candidatus Buchananbacteria bacterium]
MKAKEELKELKLKSEAELHRLLASNREKLRDLRFKVSQNQLKNIREIRQIKKKIAKISTLINQKKNNNSNK